MRRVKPALLVTYQRDLLRARRRGLPGYWCSALLRECVILRRFARNWPDLLPG